MLEQIFMTIFVTSCIGAALTLFLTVLSPITKKCFSSRWHYYIWLVVLAVMIVPVSFKLPGKIWHEDPVSTVVSRLSEMEIVETMRNSEITAGNFTYKVDFPAEEVYNSVETVRTMAVNKMDVISGIWIITAVLMLAVKMLKYALFLQKIRRDTKLISCPELRKFTDRKIHVRMSETICSPLMVGILRPTMILPKEALSAEQLDNVLAHEVTHFKRKDIWYKWFVGIVKCIHWFNPAVYIAEKLIDKECEISCDLEVVEKMSREQEISYVNTILSLLSLRKAKSIPLTTGMASCKKTLRERFMRIKNKRRISKTAAVISCIAAIAIFAGAIGVSGILNGKPEEVKTEDNTITVDEMTGDISNLLLSLYEDGKADLIMIISFDKASQKICGTSIPADRTLETDSEKRTIADMLSGDNVEKNMIEAIKKEYSLPIHYYVSTDINTLSNLTKEVSQLLFGDSYKEMHEAIIDAYITSRAKDGTMSELESIYKKVKESLTKENMLNMAVSYAEKSEKIKTNCTIEDISEIIRSLTDVQQIDISLISGDYEEFENGVLSLYNETGRKYILQQMR